MYGGLLVGRVEEVYDTVSKVSYITDSNSNVPVVDQRSRTKGLVHGSLEGLVMEEILQQEDIKEGDRIVTLGDQYPEGFLIGTVRQVIMTDTSSKKTAILEAAVDYSDLEKVYIITNFLVEDLNIE